MSDTNDILRKLAAQAGGEAALSALERALSSADGRRAVSSLSASHEALLRAAADRAASGDLSAPRALARSLAAIPEGATLADALRRSGTDGPAVMVGDRRFDVAGAHENGLPAIGVLYGYGGREELENAGADYLAADLHELKQLLLQE